MSELEQAMAKELQRRWIAYANHQPFMYVSPERAIYMAGAEAGIEAVSKSTTGDTAAAQKVLMELSVARYKFPPMHSAHEGLAILEEEFLELRAEVFWGTRELMREEAIQVAAMAIRFIVDVCDRDE